jgi:hypothetical protein
VQLLLYKQRANLENKRNDQQDFGTPGELFAEARGENAIFPILQKTGLKILKSFPADYKSTRAGVV